MKSLKTSSLFRLAALLLVAVITICMVGFVTEGWQSEPQNQPESGDTDENSGDTDENTDGGGNAEIPAPPSPPEYTHYLTGLETTAEESRQKPLCFVMDASSPLYGIYGSPLTIEIPIEGGQSRLLVYRNHTQNLGKIGSCGNSNTENFFDISLIADCHIFLLSKYLILLQLYHIIFIVHNQYEKTKIICIF